MEQLQKCPALRLLAFFRDARLHEDKEPLGVALHVSGWTVDELDLYGICKSEIYYLVV